MDKWGEDFVLIVGDVGVERLDRVVGCAVVWEERRRGLSEGGFDGGVAASKDVLFLDWSWNVNATVVWVEEF